MLCTLMTLLLHFLLPFLLAGIINQFLWFLLSWKINLSDALCHWLTNFEFSGQFAENRILYLLSCHVYNHPSQDLITQLTLIFWSFTQNLRTEWLWQRRRKIQWKNIICAVVLPQHKWYSFTVFFFFQWVVNYWTWENEAWGCILYTIWQMLNA